MALFQGIELRTMSGSAGSTMMTVESLQNVNIPFDIPRADVKSLNRFRPEVRRPVNGYTPVNMSFDVIKKDNILETALGLVTNNGVITALTNTKTTVGYGARNFEVLTAPLHGTNYEGYFTIHSGVLNSYSVSASVGDFAKSSYSFQGTDLTWLPRNEAKTGVNSSVNAVRSQDVTMGTVNAIEVSGFGISGFEATSFNLSLNISRTEVNKLGSKFPTERPMVDAMASIQLQGFINGGNHSMSGLGAYDCGSPTTGELIFTLTPACGVGPATTYRAINPYLKGLNQGYSLGSFASVDMSFEIPLPITAAEAAGASNLLIS